MKRFLSLSLLVLWLLFAPYAWGAGTWEEIFRALIDQRTGNELIESGKLYQGTLYSANIRFTITDRDGNSNNFRDQDIIDMEILGTGLRFQGNKQQLVSWANSNGRAIYDAIFPTDVGGEVTGGSDSQHTQQRFFSDLLFRSLNEDSPNANSVIARMEFTFATVGEDKEDVFGFTGIPSYSVNFGKELEHVVGLNVPFRYAKQDDILQSELFSVTINPYVRFKILTRESVFVEEDNFGLYVGANALLHTTMVSSVMLKGGVGYFRYGGGIFTAADWTPSEYLTIRVGLAYQISKAYFDQGLVNEEMKWLVDTLNDLPIDHEVSYGVNFTVPLSDHFTVSLDYFRISSLGSRVEANQHVSTIAMLFSYFLADTFDLSIGYKTRLEMENVTEHTILLGGVVRF